MTKSNLPAEIAEVDTAVYKTLLESTNAIPWKLDWATLKFEYIGPQIEKLLGWPQASWATSRDWIDRIYSEDKTWVVDYCIAKSIEGEDYEVDYRAMNKDGGYVWIRDVVHVVRNPDGTANAFIGFMFDISERKKTEEKLITLQKKLEELSFKDGLTGIANRRMFDSVMELEWLNARRNKQPISLIMVDIDYFKQYNDHYGHIHGDDSLKRVAQVLSKVATRSRDFCARFGGEEFVLVLPETDAFAAKKVAERCHQVIFKEQIMHAKSEVSQLLTVSAGVGTIVPTSQDESLAFIHEVDRRLYLAKQKGRNRIITAAD